MEDHGFRRLECVEMAGVKCLALGALAGLASLIGPGTGASLPDHHAAAVLGSGLIAFGGTRAMTRNEEIYVVNVVNRASGGDEARRHRVNGAQSLRRSAG